MKEKLIIVRARRFRLLASAGATCWYLLICGPLWAIIFRNWVSVAIAIPVSGVVFWAFLYVFFLSGIRSKKAQESWDAEQQRLKNKLISWTQNRATED